MLTLSKTVEEQTYALATSSFDSQATGEETKSLAVIRAT